MTQPIEGEQTTKADEHPDYITITYGMRGYFAVHMRWYDEDGFAMYEPENSGIGSYKTSEKAEPEARQWAQAEGIEFKR